jgi:hypothetical protein
MTQFLGSARIQRAESADDLTEEATTQMLCVAEEEDGSSFGRIEFGGG